MDVFHIIILFSAPRSIFVLEVRIFINISLFIIITFAGVNTTNTDSESTCH